jgi:hypothetical protein
MVHGYSLLSETLMNILINILAIAIIGAIASLPALLLYLKEKKARIKSEKMLSVVRQMGEFDDRIFRMRQDDPEDWPASREAQMLIAHRIRLHDTYSAFLRHQVLRDCEYITELRSSAVTK